MVYDVGDTVFLPTRRCYISGYLTVKKVLPAYDVAPKRLWVVAPNGEEWIVDEERCWK